MNNLNEYQIKASEYKGKHLLVLAGAGTGKTKTIIARAEYLIKSGVQPNNIAILSFTRKSAQEIVERVKSSLTGQFNASAINGRTFHSWCNEIMHTYPDYFPQSKYTLLDEDDQNSAMGLSIGKKLRDSEGEKISPEYVVSVYSYTVNTLCSLSESIRHLRYFNSDKTEEELKNIIEKDKSIIAPIIKQYLDYKSTRRYIDYDDMLNIVATALEKNEIIKNAVSNKWKHILVDEMQDTNPLQYKLLKSFIENSHLFCVGDDAQSIYAFRGADFKTIHSFTEIVPNSEAYKLLLNYRSTKEILDLSNWLLEQSPLNYDKKLLSYRGSGEKPEIVHTENEWVEANIITDYIIKCVTEENCSWKDNLVLGRSSWALSKVEGACLQKKIPYIKLGGTALMQSAHVRDVASAMRVIANNYDEIAWIRFLKLWEGIGDVTASKIITHILSLESFEQIITYLQNSNNKAIVEAIPETLERVHKFIYNVPKAMREAMNAMNIILQKKYKDEWNYRISDFDVLEEVAKSSGSISEFITEYVLDPRAETTLKGGADIRLDGVILSTIHSAKGLEAKNVHITAVNPNGYPSIRTIKQGLDAIEEERRCLYVAITRAKDNLKLYRNSKSLHTQLDKDAEEIKIRGMYITKTLENKEVLVLKIENNTVSVLNQKIKKIEEYSISDFQQNFVETESQAEKLYFLNKLPVELVEIIIPEKDKIQHENDLLQTKPAQLPDFNFE